MKALTVAVCILAPVAASMSASLPASSMPEGWTPPRPKLAILRAAADLYGLPHELVLAVAKVESDLNPLAISHKGAVGLMQVMPETARWLGFDGDLTDPTLNALAGCAYLRYWMDRGVGTDLALVAYNTGRPRWSDAGSRYVRKVRCKINDKPTS